MKTIITPILLPILITLLLTKQAEGNIYIVTSSTDGTSGSLRDCINQANSASGSHQITFSISGTFTITSTLPSFSKQIYVNGTTAPSYSGSPLIEIVASGTVNNAFNFNNPAASLSTIEGICIRGFSGDAILINGTSNLIIKNCRIGTNLSGSSAAANGGSGISMIGVGSNTIDNCVISGNILNGIFGNNSSNNIITNCKIGCAANGLSRIENSAYGIFFMNGSNSNIIGGAGNGNIISGNKIHGIYLASDPSNPSTSPGSNNNKIYGNYIGVDASGNSSLSNGENGVSILNSTGNIIGGSTSGQGNVISGNGYSSAGVGTYNSGITLYQLSQGANNTKIEGNLIGVGADGSAAIGNSGYGIYSYNCNSIIIGGTNKKLSRNIISANGYGYSFNGPGIYIENGTSINIFNNYIGTDSTGTIAKPNKGSGINLNTNASSCRIGGISSDSLNVISGNNENGIYLHNNSYNTIIGNYIGVDKTGTASLSNGENGVFGDLTCLHTTIGGSTSTYRNIISGNKENGIFFQSKSHYLSINGNYIGTNKNGSGSSSSFGNGLSGIKLDSCQNAQIGVNRGNVLSGNGQLYGGPTSGLNGSGITIIRGSTDATIQNNIIGLAADGTTAMGNIENGITLYLGCHNALIGGTSSQKNIISSNGYAYPGNPTGQGIVVDESDNVSIYGNYLGTDITGLLNKGNNQSGIIGIWVNNLSIGQAIAGKGNIIAGNNELGIHLVGGNTNSTSSSIYNNYIGVGSDGTTSIGNSCGGILIIGASDATAGTFGINYTIGGTASLQKNIIAYSTGTNTRFGNGYGIGVAGDNLGNKNVFIDNKIFCNKGKGIDLNFSSSQFLSGYQPGNGGKTAPTITSSNGILTQGTGISGETIHLYYNPSYAANSNCDCEGEVYLGSAVVSGGTWSITHSNIGSGTISLAATATDLSSLTKGTSEFTPCNTSLPVDMLSLNASAFANEILLQWETMNEKNNDHFEIEKSSDGIKFYTIGKVNGSSEPTFINDYQFIDNNPFSGTVYYRLKQVDINGQFNYSKIVIVTDINKNNILNVYPNPTEGILHILLNTKGDYEITIIDELGQTLKNEIFNNQNIGTKEINISEFVSGIYYLIVSSNGDFFRNKIYKK